MDKLLKKIELFKQYFTTKLDLSSWINLLKDKTNQWLVKKVNHFKAYLIIFLSILRDSKLLKGINLLIKQVKIRETILLFLLAMSITGFLHGYNMFHYPYFESDEGTYLSQAFAVKNYG